MQPYPPLVYQQPPGAAPSAQPPTPPLRELPFAFTGSAKEYFRIWIVNVALTIVTLGIYSAWAKVRTRQYFYRHTRVDGSSFDYLGNPVSILKGRLIIGAALAALAASQHYSLTLYGALFAALMLSTPLLLVKGLQFNARNSAYRNVRFAFMGNVGEAYGVYLQVLVMYVITCGLGYPWAQWRFTRFIAERHLLGDERFSFSARAGQYFRVYWLVLAMTLPIFLLMGIAMFALVQSGGPESAKAAMAPLYVLVYAYLLIPGAFIKASTANLFYSNLGLGEHGFVSRQRFAEVLKLYVVNLFGIAISLGLLIPWAKVRMAQYRASRLTFMAAGTFEASVLDWQGRANALGDAAMDLGDVGFDVGV